MWFVRLRGISEIALFCSKPHNFGIFINDPQTSEVTKPVFITTEQGNHYQSLNGLDRWTGNPNQASDMKDSSQETVCPFTHRTNTASQLQVLTSSKLPKRTQATMACLSLTHSLTHQMFIEHLLFVDPELFVVFAIYTLWLIHVDVWQKPIQYCKTIILQLKMNKLKPKRISPI